MNKYEDMIAKLRDYKRQDLDNLMDEAADMIEELIKAPPNPRHYTIKAETGIIGLKSGD